MRTMAKRQISTMPSFKDPKYEESFFMGLKHDLNQLHLKNQILKICIRNS